MLYTGSKCDDWVWCGYPLLHNFVFRLDNLKRDTRNPNNEYDADTADIRRRMSEQSMFGDTYQMENVRNRQEMSRMVQVSFTFTKNFVSLSVVLFYF